MLGRRSGPGGGVAGGAAGRVSGPWGGLEVGLGGVLSPGAPGKAGPVPQEGKPKDNLHTLQTQGTLSRCKYI